MYDSKVILELREEAQRKLWEMTKQNIEVRHSDLTNRLRIQSKNTKLVFLLSNVIQRNCCAIKIVIT